MEAETTVEVCLILFTRDYTWQQPPFKKRAQAPSWSSLSEWSKTRPEKTAEIELNNGTNQHKGARSLYHI